ncbi:MAG TPA: nitrilase-related carbon-nitrogen hydrolase [Kofleriaceae bacterium]|nr:nitrilase-related carbon-nitrogen hydrolase [Kofleriaceae bacterium]
MRAALVGIQLEIGAEVLGSAERYRQYIEDVTDAALRAASEREHGGAADAPPAARFVVFPELAGHLALLALAPPAARRARTLGAALAASAVRRPLDVLRGVATARTLHPRHAVLAALAPDGERYWRAIFGPLARRHRAYLVAGSHLRLRDGFLTNASLLFSPEGRCEAVTDKVNLVPGLEDGAPGALGLARGDAERLPIVETALGRACTLICYDGFHVPHTPHERFSPVPPVVAARGGVTVAANPAANPWPWDGPWPPPGLPARAAGGTRAEQWAREGLAGSLGAAPFARYAVTAHLVGEVLDLRFDGSSEILERTGAGVRVLARADDSSRGGHVTAAVDL